MEIPVEIEKRATLAIVLSVALLSPSAAHAGSRATSLVKQGGDALKDGEYSVAVARLSDALRLAPENVEAWSLRGEAYAMQGDHNRALADCAQAVKLAPTSSEVYRRCGVIYSTEKNYQAAMADYDRAIRLDPHNALAYGDRGDTYFHLGQTDRAISDYNEALKLDPSESQTYALRGNAWLVKGDFDGAWDDYNRAIQSNPRNAYAYVCRGYAAAQRYAFDDAIANYNEALRIQPGYKTAQRYRREAEEQKNAATWGEVMLALFGIGILALLYAAFRVYRSPRAFSHSVERFFRRTADGRLVFYPALRGRGYLVPDADKELELRAFARHHGALALASGAAVVIFLFALAPITFRLTSWVVGKDVTEAVILTASFTEVSIVFAILRGGFSIWRRAAVRGLEPATEKMERSRREDWLGTLILDMPLAVRWVALAVAMFLLFGSVDGLWRMRHDLSPAGISGISLFGWMSIGVDLGVLYWLGCALIKSLQLYRRRSER